VSPVKKNLLTRTLFKEVLAIKGKVKKDAARIKNTP